MTIVNHQFRLAARPTGVPKPSDWNLTEEPAPEPGDGEFLVKILYVSLDPAMRGWMNEGRSHVAPVGIGKVMKAGAIGQIVASNRPGFLVGDHVHGAFGVQEYALSRGDRVTRVDPALAPLPVFLGTLGAPGMTAYFGLLDIGKPKSGETVVVSGAASPIGMIAGQIATIYGCRVIGIAGGPKKCRHLVAKLGFDAAIDNKSQDVRKALRQHCPNGIDVYFDNVGGDILEAAMANLARRARIALCGGVSQYNGATPGKTPPSYAPLVVNRASMAGMVVSGYADRFPEAANAIAGWLASGKLKSRENIVAGFSKFPETLIKLLTRGSLGKLVLQVAEA
ncbi:MAG: NADP-dependent oxidoreductase [Roseiarcus sp.]